MSKVEQIAGMLVTLAIITLVVHNSSKTKDVINIVTSFIAASINRVSNPYGA